MPFVIDNAVVSGWYLENQATPYTEAIAQRLREDRAVAPALWELELTNVLRTACLRQRMTAEKAQQVLARRALPGCRSRWTEWVRHRTSCWRWPCASS